MHDFDTAAAEQRLQSALQFVEQAAQACAGSAQNVAGQLERLASARAHTADRLLDRSRAFGKEVGALMQAGGDGAACLQAAWESFGDALERVLLAAAGTAAQTRETVEQASSNGQTALAFLSKQLKQYLRIADQGHQDLLDLFREDGGLLSQSLEPAAHVQEAMFKAGDQTHAILRHAERRSERDKRDRAQQWNRQGCEELADGKLAAAQNSFQTACQLYSAAEPRFNLALTFYLQHNLKEAQHALAEARSLGIPSALADVLDAMVALAGNDDAKIRLAATELPKLSGSDPVLQAVRAACLLATGQADAALRHLAVTGGGQSI